MTSIPTAKSLKQRYLNDTATILERVLLSPEEDVSQGFEENSVAKESVLRRADYLATSPVGSPTMFTPPNFSINEMNSRPAGARMLSDLALNVFSDDEDGFETGEIVLVDDTDGRPMRRPSMQLINASDIMNESGDNFITFKGSISDNDDVAPSADGAADTPQNGTAGSNRIQSMEFVSFGSRLGRGNCGSVMRALNLEDFRVYALKSIAINQKANRQQIMKELNTYNSTDCPYLVSFHGAYYDQTNTTFVIEYMNRGSLQDVIDQQIPTSISFLQRVAKQILLGLQHMHDMRQVHRDIKPANILLNRRGDCKITDFGIVRALEPSEDAQTFVGTRVYMSPERIKSQQYSFPSDIWSFGLTMHTLATGEFPYTSGISKGFIHLFQTITQAPTPLLDSSLFPQDMVDFLSRCLEKDPMMRWTSAQLLQHPFVRDTDATGPIDIPLSDDARDEEDLDDIAQILATTKFSETPYTRSDNTKTVLGSIAESLSMDIVQVQQTIERLLPIHCLAPFE